MCDGLVEKQYARAAKNLGDKNLNCHQWKVPRVLRLCQVVSCNQHLQDGLKVIFNRRKVLFIKVDFYYDVAHLSRPQYLEQKTLELPHALLVEFSSCDLEYVKSFWFLLLCKVVSFLLCLNHLA